MAQLSLQTAGITWGRFVVRQTRGLALAALVAAVSIPVVVGVRSADLVTGQLQNLLVIVAATLSAAAALGLAWLIRPDLTLGGDGAW